MGELSDAATAWVSTSGRRWGGVDDLAENIGIAMEKLGSSTVTGNVTIKVFLIAYDDWDFSKIWD